MKKKLKKIENFKKFFSRFCLYLAFEKFRKKKFKNFEFFDFSILRILKDVLKKFSHPKKKLKKKFEKNFGLKNFFSTKKKFFLKF